MTTTGAVSIRAALETRLKAMTSALDTQWENQPYKPSAGKPYQKVDLLFADPINSEMGGQYQEQGYLQVMLRYPVGVGSGQALTQAQAVRDWFPKGLSLTASGVTVNINKTPSISGASLDGDRYCIPVKIRFFSNSLI